MDPLRARPESQTPPNPGGSGSIIPEADPLRLRVFAGLFGALLGLALLKFANPPVLEKLVSPPENVYEFIIGSLWPIAWGYALLGLVAVLGFAGTSWRLSAPKWLAAMPLAWLIWQFIAGTQSIDASLTRVTLAHFSATVLCFYLGLFALSRVRNLMPFWLGLLFAFLIVLAVGWQQHFGGLEQTRRYFFLYIYPQMKEVSPEHLKKVQSDRVFSTLFYPNVLAGGLLLLLPAMLVTVWGMRRWFTTGARAFLTAAIAVGALGCLYWSGSKGGWLLMLLLGLLVLLRLPFDNRYKVALVAIVLVLGLVGFFWRYSTFFQRGAKSVGARFDYWQAAALTVQEKPLFGTGPGTFGIAYAKVKRPESEPAKLAHNDYIEQASDSGLPGFLLYLVTIANLLAGTFPRADWARFLLWLGVLGWCLQGLMEFGLYIPALSWPAFALLGWLLGTSKSARCTLRPHDKPLII